MVNNSSKSDEIDLHVIYNKVKEFIFGLWDYISNVFRIVKKRWALVLVFALLGTGAGAGLFFITKPTYIATVTLSSSMLSNDYCADIIHGLQLIIEDNTPKLLAQKLKIDTTAAKEIKGVEFYNYYEKITEKNKDKDTVILGLPFKIKVCASNNTVFDTLQKALVNYLENNAYALKRKEINKENNQLMRYKLNAEIQQLDSLKSVVASNLLPRTTLSGFVFGQPLDPINVYREGINLFQHYLDLNKESLLIDNIQVIIDFSPRDRPDNPVLWKSITEGVIAGLFLSLITVFILERKKKNVQ